jgi:hypothetical protein
VTGPADYPGMSPEQSFNWDVFSRESGSFYRECAQEPNLLAPGATVKEALLIIRFRLDA